MHGLLKKFPRFANRWLIPSKNPLLKRVAIARPNFVYDNLREMKSMPTDAASIMVE